MIRIAHRGNRNGPNHIKENTKKYIEEALAEGYHVEVDVWVKDWCYHLGHDGPMDLIARAFLQNPKLICHAKNMEALMMMLQDGIHCFWHEGDECALTSQGLIWKYPEVYDKDGLWGVCGDYV